VRPIEDGVLAVVVRRATDVASSTDDPAAAIETAVAALAEGIDGFFPSVFVLDHGRLWLVAQRGYAVVPDGMSVESGIIGRAVRLGRAQLVSDVASDPDYVVAIPGLVAELAAPLRSGRVVVGALNLESERPLPACAAETIRPLSRALARHAAALSTGRQLDLPALARLFVRLGSLRDPVEIAQLAAASLPRVLPLSTSQVLVWDESGAARELGLWSQHGGDAKPLAAREVEAARARSNPSTVCDVFDVPLGGRARRSQAVAWLPLRANANELGAIVGVRRDADEVDPSLLDTAAVLAAHVAASLDAAFALDRERRSAVSDPLTGVLNRRGLEERLVRELEDARTSRSPVSLLVIDCDDFKEINDRAGHEFGDTILREIADVLMSSLREGAEAARIGGDEFVVMLPGADADAAEAAGTEIRRLLAEGLTDAGYPVHVSAGISTYPFDAPGATALLRAADQALYAAKVDGKDRIASFRDLIGSTSRPTPPHEPKRRGRSEGSMLADALAALRAIESEETAQNVCGRLCKSLVFVVGATGCSISRVVGELVVDATEHALREVRLTADETAYRIDDFPLTAEVLRTGKPRAVSFLQGGVDPAEAFILRDLGMNALLMLPLVVGGQTWGLVELYEMRLRSFGDEEIAVAQFLTFQAERRIEAVGDSAPPLGRTVYELPRAGGRVPRVR